MAKTEQDSGNELAQKFDIDSPKLASWVEDNALSCDGFPYDKKIKRKDYEKELFELQIELVKLQTHVNTSGDRIVCLFEGRDTAGKGGCIKRIMMYLNPRAARTVALAKPTETEQGQWYFQRYATHLPTAGEIVLFDRSWYNRAGVERVMGYCDEQQLAKFLRTAPRFEQILVDDGIKFFKFFLTIGQEMQLKRFHDRRHNPVKRWKLTANDLASIPKWDAYTEARNEMFDFTHTTTCPWTVVRANDQRRARLETIRHILTNIDYENKDDKIVGNPDPKIITNNPAEFFDGNETG
ncbi:MAG: polyphosphate kinase 2 [Hyphomicrobiaceae bacterium]